MPTTHATSLTNGEIVEENDLGSIRRGNGRRCDLSVAARVSRSPRWVGIARAGVRGRCRR